MVPVAEPSARYDKGDGQGTGSRRPSYAASRACRGKSRRWTEALKRGRDGRPSSDGFWLRPTYGRTRECKQRIHGQQHNTDEDEMNMCFIANKRRTLTTASGRSTADSKWRVQARGVWSR